VGTRGAAAGQARGGRAPSRRRRALAAAPADLEEAGGARPAAAAPCRGLDGRAAAVREQTR